jgi:hypothetical protein
VVRAYITTSRFDMSIAPATIQITFRRRIWRVTVDGAFYGDYRSRRHAAESADAAAATLRKAGREVRLLPEPNGAAPS